MSSNNSTKSLVTAAHAAFSRGEQSNRTMLLACAAATFALAEAGLIGKDQSANGGYDSQRDYAATFVATDSNGNVISRPVSQTTVIMWRRCGRALSLGITPDAVLADGEADVKVRLTFNRLVQVFGDARVGNVADNGSKAAIVKAVASCFGRDGKKTPAPKAATANTAGEQGTGTTEGNTPEVPVTRNNSTALDAVEALLARISKPSKAERERLVDIVSRIAIIAGVDGDQKAAEFLGSVGALLTNAISVTVAEPAEEHAA